MGNLFHKKWLALVSWLFTINVIIGQDEPFQRCIEISSKNEIQFDSVVVIPWSVKVFSQDGALDSSQWNYDWIQRKLIFRQAIDSSVLTICYRILSSAFTKSYYTLEKPEILGTRRTYQYTYDFPLGQDLQQTYQQLNKSGSIERGISVNSTGGFSLSGGLNLQMSGRVAENLWLTAVLTDANIPIQPDGTTAQLNEIDRMFVQVYNPKIRATLGDYTLSYNQNFFLKASKKIQGFRFELLPPENLSDTFHYSAEWAGAVNRGKYHRQWLKPVEGNQGPYKLVGANNEVFIVVLAGSEKVYFNGILLQRGENEDYVMDYNTAEIRFTTKRPISRESRIVVEFEYTDQTYVRFTAAHVSRLVNSRHLMEITFFSESDAKYQTIDQPMSDAWIELLRQAGDTSSGIFVDNVQQMPFDPEVISYARVDTLVNGITYTIYRFSTNPQLSVYRVGFTYVGQNKGDYVLAWGLANGRVFRWVAPIDGVPQGSYAPIIQLTPPSSRQNVAFRSVNQISPLLKTVSELVYSYSDLNTFSAEKNSDNHGLAFRSELHAGNDTIRWFFELGYTYIDRRFSSFDRFLPPEFERDWNLNSTVTSQTKHWVSAKVVHFQPRWGRVTYLAEGILSGDAFRGLKNTLSSNIRLGAFGFSTQTSLVNSEEDSLTANFVRTQTQLAYSWKFISSGIRVLAEDIRRELKTGGYDNLSQQFLDYSLFLSANENSKLSGELAVGVRDDKKVAQRELHPFTHSQYIHASGNFNFSSSQNWGIAFNYKRIEIPNPEVFTAISPEKIVGGRISNRMVFFKRMLITSGFYEIGTGMESKKEYTFLRTVPGQGTHVWRDVNQNGIQELWEFEIATIPQEADFIRVFIPTNEFINAYYSYLNNTIQLSFSRWSASEQRVLRWLSFLSNQTNISVRQRLSENRFESYGNPFYWIKRDSTLISNQVNFKNVVSIGQNSPYWGIDFIKGYNQNRGILSSGFETRTNGRETLVLRLVPWQPLAIYNELQTGRSIFSSDLFSFKNYTILSKQWEGRIEYIFSTQLRIETSVRYAERENTSVLNQSYTHELKGGFYYSRLKTGTLNGSVSYVWVTLNGSQSEPSNFELLEGLQPGRNYIWQLNSVVRLTEKLNLTLQYHGRTALQMKTIHTGMIHLRAYF